jgi:transcriptional regulator of acetoin/glycerol metabolism
MHWWSCEKMRGDTQPRTWLRWSELWAMVRSEMPLVGTNDVRAAIKAMQPRPVKVYGHYHFEKRHVAFIRRWAEERGLA